MHAIAAGPSTSVQEERLALFITVQYGVEVSMYQYNISTPSHQHPAQDAPMGEKRPATKQNVWPMPREAFKALQERSIDSPRAKLVNELIIVDSQLLPIARDGTLYVPRRYDLIVRCRRICRLDRAGKPCGGGPAGLQPWSDDEVLKRLIWLTLP